MTRQILSTPDDEDSAGFTILFQDFYEEVYRELEKVEEDDDKILDYLPQINEYVMRKLHVAVWHRDRPQNRNDTAYTDKQNSLNGSI